jgi:peptidoglycan/LPS O-acetylase OafA/YrhL
MRPCVEVGRISHAIYLFHAFMPALVRLGTKSAGLIWLRSTAPTLVLSVVLTLIAAEL